MGTLLQDLRFAARSLRKTPGFTAVAVLSLGLGIGATTTVLCWMKNILWQPLPGVPHQEQLAVLVSNPGGGNVSLLDLRDLGSLSQVFAGAAASQSTRASIIVDRQAEWAHGQIATANYFELLGVKPVVGRTFLPDEDAKPGGNPVVVISETYWRRRFGGDPAIVGRTLDLNRHTFTVVGVVPAEFQGTLAAEAFDFWAPLSMLQEVANWSVDWLPSRSARAFHNVARLRTGVSLAQAQAAVSALDVQLANAYPRTNLGIHHRVVALADCPYGAQAENGPALRLLLAVSVGVLLIVAANLLLGRAVSRQKEIAIRLATGAGRWRLVRQMATESLLLALLGGALGVVLAFRMVWLPRLFDSGIDSSLPLFHIDGETLGFALLVTLASGVLFGLVPALQATRPRLYETLKEGGRSSGAGVTHHRLRHALVVAEVALTLVLLVGAGLCVKGLRQARAIEVGFDPNGVLIAELQVGMNGYKEETAKTLYRRIQQRLSALPGVQEVALASWSPLGMEGCKGLDAFVEGYQPPPGEDGTYEYARVSPRYFALMHIPLLAGRDFNDQDDAQAPAVAIVNEHFAQRFWPGQNPIGRRFRAHGTWRTIVGLAKAGKYNHLTERAWPFFYLPYQQGVPYLDLSVSLRTSGDPASFAQAVRRTIHEIDPGVDLLGTKTLVEHTQAIFFAHRVASILLLGLGAIGLALAAMGVYAVMAYAVSQRTQEFGVRLAVGASQQDLVRLVIRKGLLLALLGSAVGLALASAVTRSLSGFLFGVSPFDPLTFTAIPAFLAGVAVLACWLPARRAARTDPMAALRCE